MEKKRIKENHSREVSKDRIDIDHAGSRPGSTTSSVASESAAVSREATPAPLGRMPKYQYSKDDLMKIKESLPSQTRALCLNKEHDSPEGMWDPEKWFRSFDSSRGSSPLGFAGQRDRERKRSADAERDSLFKRRSSADPKGRIKEEEEDVGIILSPQRRSFGGGCHVTAPSTQRARPGSPQDAERERERRSEQHQRRIGSGRIQIGERHDTLHERDRENFRDRERDRDRDRDRDRERDATRDRDVARGRFDRDDRFERGNMDRYSRDSRDRDRDGRREYGDRRFDGRLGFRRQHSQEEPEWFTGGPSSQHETIELHGFEGPAKESKETTTLANVNEVEEHRPSSRTDRNGSLETNESSSPEASQNSDPDDSHHQASGPSQPKQQDFDFGDFLKMSNIPGLNMNMEVPGPPIDTPVIGGSRFSQWFQQTTGAMPGSQGNSRNNSRRSSINEEFSYLNDLVGGSGQKSPVIPSPPLNSHRFFSPITTPEEKQQHHLLEMLHQAKVNVQPLLNDGMPHQAFTPGGKGNNEAREVEANLKALLMCGANCQGQPGKPNIPQLAMPPGGKFLTAAELEATLVSHHSANTSQQSPSVKNQPTHPGQAPGANLNACLSFTSVPPVIPTGKVTTVAELEAGIKDVNLKDKPDSGKYPTQMANQTPQNVSQAKGMTPNSGQKNTASDMAAFNRLLGMIQKASETPKRDGQPLSPGSAAQAQKDAVLKQQNELIQKLIQQQRHQAQAKLQQQQQQQQQAKLQQLGQIQQQQQLQELLKMMKNQGMMAKPPASPIPPQMTLQPPMSPRCPSPVVPQNLLQQPPPSPRAPSPIMFGSQPPMHLTAPAPIHANQLTPPSPTQTLSPNTLQVGVGTGSSSPVMQRVPSPQELRAHTQAIMQNALIKKQLEDQKERFLKRQQDGSEPKQSTFAGRAKSPMPGGMLQMPIMTSQSPGTVMNINSVAPTTGDFKPYTMGSAVSTPSSQATVAPSFMPTSVIRKLANDKAEEKERQHATNSPDLNNANQIGNHQSSPERPPPVLKIVQPEAEDGEETSELTEEQRRFIEQAGLLLQREQMMLAQQGGCHNPSPPGMETPPLCSVAADGSINIPVPQTPQTPQTPMGQPHLQGQYPQINLTPADSGIMKRRPLMGQGTMNYSNSSQGSLNLSTASGINQTPTTPMSTSSPQTPGSGSFGRPIVKSGGVTSPLEGHRALTGIKQENSQTSQTSQQPGQRPIVGQVQNNTPPNIDINKVIEMHRQQLQAAQRQNSMPPLSPNLPRANQTTQYGMPITGRMPGTPVTPVSPAVTSNANALLMQRMMQHNMNSPHANRTPVPNQINQLNQFSPLAALQAVQGRGMDPRIQGVRPGVYPQMTGTGINPAALATSGSNARTNFGNTLNAAVINAVVSRALSPQPHITPAIASLAATQDGMNGPLSPRGLNRAVSPNPMAALLGARVGAESNLAKWFGNDVLKQQMPNMPPLPTQGQKVMTVDEIERRQQTVTH